MAIHNFTEQELSIIINIICSLISAFTGCILFRIIKSYFTNNSPHKQKIQSYKDLGINYITGKSNVYKHLKYIYTEFNNKIYYYDKHGNRVNPEFDETAFKK